MSIRDRVIEILQAAAGHALHVSTIASRAPCARSAVSHEMSKLNEEGLVTWTRKGWYRWNMKGPGPTVQIIRSEAPQEPKTQRMEAQTQAPQQPTLDAPPIEPAQEPRPEPKRQAHAIVPLTFEGYEFRTINRGEERLWVLVDVCEANDIGNPSQVASRLGADEKDALIINDAMGRPQRVTVVNEAGLYEAMRPSQKPFAKRFWHWVCHEVLPSIRKTGSYTVPGAQPAGSSMDMTALATTVATAVATAIAPLIRELKGEPVVHSSTVHSAPRATVHDLVPWFDQQHIIGGSRNWEDVREGYKKRTGQSITVERAKKILKAYDWEFSTPDGERNSLIVPPSGHPEWSGYIWQEIGSGEGGAFKYVRKRLSQFTNAGVQAAIDMLVRHDTRPS